MSQVRAMRHTIERVSRGQDTIAATGNILRDYLTDLFPILELGTSTEMLSIVPLMAGGGMYETGAGGSAPKHVQSAGGGEPPAVGFPRRVPCARGQFGRSWDQDRQLSAKILAKTLDAATGRLLANNRNPSRKTGELDNRGSQFYLALYWAKELAAQTDDQELRDHFAALSDALGKNEDVIVKSSPKRRAGRWTSAVTSPRIKNSPRR